MEYEDSFTRLDSYKETVRQIVNYKKEAIDYLRKLAGKDLGLSLEDLLELKKFAEREVYDESDNKQ